MRVLVILSIALLANLATATTTATVADETANLAVEPGLAKLLTLLGPGPEFDLVQSMSTGEDDSRRVCAETYWTTFSWTILDLVHLDYSGQAGVIYLPADRNTGIGIVSVDLLNYRNNSEVLPRFTSEGRTEITFDDNTNPLSCILEITS